MESAKIFRDAGIRVSLQIANTVGHRDWDPLKPEYNSYLMKGMRENGEVYEGLVGPDGKQCYSCFCWRGKRFRKYIDGLVTIYAEKLKTHCLWLDDDLRPYGHYYVRYGCFCDDCIRAFNEENRTSYTREDLSYEVGQGDTDVRERFLDFTKKGVREFLFGIVRSCLAVSPNTHFGFEYGHMADYPAMNENYIIEALADASGKPVETRPGGGYYNDKSPFMQYTKASTLSQITADLPDCVSEVKAEIENLPGVAFGKSIGGIVNEGTLDLAYGCTGLTFTDLQSCHEPIAYYERILKRFSEIRPYWERLSMLTRATDRGGAAIFRSKKANLKPIGKDAPPFSWATIPSEAHYNWMRIGLPVTFEKKGASAFLLHSFDVRGLTDEDIIFLLTQPVMADAESVQVLCERGFSASFDFSLKEIHDENAMEHYTEHPVNQGYVGCFMHENPYATAPMRRFVFEGIGKDTEEIGQMRTHSLISDGSAIGTSSVLTRIKSTGARRAIFGYNIWSDLISAAKRNQLAGALDAICKMPARLLGEEQAALIPAVTKDKRCAAVTVSSVSQGGAEEMQLLVRRPIGTKITAFTSRGRAYAPTLEVKTEDEILITLPPIDPYELVTLFFE